MHRIADYVADLRALGRVIRAISVVSSSDDGSAWYELSAVLERSPSPARSLRLDGYWDFESYEVEHSGGMTILSPDGRRILSYPERIAGERAASIELGQAVAAALGVPCYVTPPDADRGPHVDWLQQELSVRLVALLAKARQILVLSGTGFAPANSTGSNRYADLQKSAEARLTHWTEKLETWEGLESWKSIRAHRDTDPYSALAALDRRGILEGVIAETSLGHLQTSGLHHERVAEIYGSLAQVECLSCHRRAPSAPAFEAFRSVRQVPRCSCGGWLKLAVIALGQTPRPEALERARRFAQRADLVLVVGSQLTTNPSQRIALEPVRSRGVPLVLLTREATEVDPLATLVIDGCPDFTLPFAVRLLG